MMGRQRRAFAGLRLGRRVAAQPRDPSATTVDTRDIGGQVLSGLGWKLISQLVQQGTQVAVAVLLARLLTPRDYGLAGMVLVFSSLITIFSDLALGAALIQKREVSDLDCTTAFWTSTAGGLSFTLLGIGLSWPMAWFYNEPRVQPLFAVLSLSFVLTAMGTTQTALLSRRMDFRRLELRVMAAAVVGGCVGLAIAASGGGSWALIVQRLVLAATSTAMVWRLSPWRPSFHFSRGSLGRLGAFSRNVFSANVLFYVGGNIDNVLVGRLLGAAALGAYAVAFNLILFPVTRLVVPLRNVLFPAFSRMQGDKARMAAAWTRVNRLVSAISVPTMLGLIVLAPDFVPVVLGQRWHAAIPVIQILVWVGLLQSVQRLNSSILQACNRTGMLLAFAALNTVGNVAGIIVGLRWGVVGVAAALAVVSTLTQPFYTWLTSRALGVSPWRFVSELRGVAEAGVLMLAALIAFDMVLPADRIGHPIHLAAGATLGAAVFILMLLWRAPEVLAEVRGARARLAR
jgi:O-antigen/teichoic acid export membrane protein